MNVFEARFTQTQACEAAGVDLAKVRVWFNRGHLTLVETDGDEERQVGLAHRLSARTALRIAITEALAPFVSPSKAAPIVQKFMDSGGARMDRPRDPGGLFDDGETILCVFADGKALVENYRPGEEFAPDRDGRTYVRLPMDDLHATVLGRLRAMNVVPVRKDATAEGPAAPTRKAKVDA